MTVGGPAPAPDAHDSHDASPEGASDDSLAHGPDDVDEHEHDDEAATDHAPEAAAEPAPEPAVAAAPAPEHALREPAAPERFSLFSWIRRETPPVREEPEDAPVRPKESPDH